MRRKENKIDWKMLAGIDLNSFEEEIDRKRYPIHEIAEMISTFDVDLEFDVNAIDHHFVKVFRLTQLLLKHFSSECKLLKSRESEFNKDRNVMDENKKMKKLLKIYQRAFSFADIDAMNNCFQCPHCPKAFSEVLALKNHVSRRHPKNGLEAEGTFVLSNKIAEYNATLFTDTNIMKNVKKEMDDIKEKLIFTETALFEERREREKLQEKMEAEIIKKVEEIQENLRESEQLKSEKVLNQLKNDFRNQLIQASVKNDFVDEQGQPMDMNSKTLQQMLLMQTNEVQRIGSSIEKMVNLLTHGEDRNNIKALPRPTSLPFQIVSKQTHVAKVDEPKEVPVPSKRSIRETIEHQVKNELETVVKSIDRNDISAKLDEELKQMGIKGDKISKEEYNGAMKQIFGSRKLKSSYKELQKLVDIKASIELSKEEVLGKSERHGDFSAETNDTNAEDKSQKRVTVVVEQRQPIKSVLKRSNGESRPKKKIRFSEKNIEISPETSDDDVQFSNDNISSDVKGNATEKSNEGIELSDNDDDFFEKETTSVSSATNETLQNKPTVGELTKLIEEKLSVQTRRPGSGAVNTVARNDKKPELKTTTISTYAGYDSD